MTNTHNVPNNLNNQNNQNNDLDRNKKINTASKIDLKV